MFLLALKSKNSIRLCAKRSAHFFQEKRFLSVLPFFADLCDRSTYAISSPATSSTIGRTAKDSIRFGMGII